jgi:CelD/BcsL family acetyltransferase involved in cellulose biosynthesis
MRTAIRSARRNLEESYALEFGMCTDRDDLPTFLEALYRNHASRWRSKGKEGVFVGERKRLFYSRLSYRLLDAGSLRFYYLKLNGTVIAQQYCFQHGNTVYLLQEGFDFDYAERNVGNVLRAMVFEPDFPRRSELTSLLAPHATSGVGRTANPSTLTFKFAARR